MPLLYKHAITVFFPETSDKIYLNNSDISLFSEPSYDSEFQHFLRGKEIVLTGTTLPKVKGLTSEQSEAMVRLSRLPAFSDLVDKVQADEVNADTVNLTLFMLWHFN